MQAERIRFTSGDNELMRMAFIGLLFRSPMLLEFATLEYTPD